MALRKQGLALVSFVVGTSVGIALSTLVQSNKSSKEASNIENTRDDKPNSSETKLDKIAKYGLPTDKSDLIFRQEYITNYNRETRNPNWVKKISSATLPYFRFFLVTIFVFFSLGSTLSYMHK